MLPLTHSLLAFGAFLAAVNAQRNCETRSFGSTDGYIVEFQPYQIDPRGAEFNIPTDTCPPEMNVVGETVLACSNLHWGAAPRIVGPPPGLFTPVYVYCDVAQYYAGATAQITQYCA